MCVCVLFEMESFHIAQAALKLMAQEILLPQPPEQSALWVHATIVI